MTNRTSIGKLVYPNGTQIRLYETDSGNLVTEKGNVFARKWSDEYRGFKFVDSFAKLTGITQPASRTVLLDAMAKAIKGTVIVAAAGRTS